MIQAESEQDAVLLPGLLDQLMSFASGFKPTVLTWIVTKFRSTGTNLTVKI